MIERKFSSAHSLTKYPKKHFTFNPLKISSFFFPDWWYDTITLQSYNNTFRSSNLPSQPQLIKKNKSKLFYNPPQTYSHCSTLTHILLLPKIYTITQLYIFSKSFNLSQLKKKKRKRNETFPQAQTSTIHHKRIHTILPIVSRKIFHRNRTKTLST